MNLKKSLKSIKKKLQKKDKLYLTIKNVYTHLSELSNEEILDYYQVQSLQELETHIERIKEILQKQMKNHKKERENINTCFCLDSRGDFKYLYPSKKEAQQQVLFSQKNKKIKLSLYACPFHFGWHLTKL